MGKLIRGKGKKRVPTFRRTFVFAKEKRALVKNGGKCKRVRNPVAKRNRAALTDNQGTAAATTRPCFSFSAFLLLRWPLSHDRDFNPIGTLAGQKLTAAKFEFRAAGNSQASDSDTFGTSRCGEGVAR